MGPLKLPIWFLTNINTLVSYTLCSHLSSCKTLFQQTETPKFIPLSSLQQRNNLGRTLFLCLQKNTIQTICHIRTFTEWYVTLKIPLYTQCEFDCKIWITQSLLLQFVGKGFGETLSMNHCKKKVWDVNEWVVFSIWRANR